MNSLTTFATTFVSKVISDAVSNIARVNTRFNKILTKSGFSFNKHQFDGVMWCVQNETKTSSAISSCPASSCPAISVKGGIIADEMGLGKTMLMIGTMFANFLPKTIIVVPPILIDQWAKEIYKCSGHNPLIYHGANKKRLRLMT